MSTLRLAGSVLGLLLLAALSALASPSENVLDGADSQELLIVRAPVRATTPIRSKPVPRVERLAWVEGSRQGGMGQIVPFAGENIPEMGQ